MNRETARAHIVFLAEADRVALTDHARTRAPHVGKYPLTREQIKQCLMKGAIVEGPAPDILQCGGWKFTMRRMRDGEKHEVAGILIVEKRVLVITGYSWELPRRRRRGQDAT